MYFEAILKKKKYKIDIEESEKGWSLSVEPEDGQKQDYFITHEDYKRMNNGISFIFENSSYMIDVVGKGLDYEVYTRGSFRRIALMNDETLLHESLKGAGSLGGTDRLTAGMPGKIIDILVQEGDEVVAGTPLLIMEAMKMENEMKAASNVKIKSVRVKKGQSVEAGAELIRYE